MDGQRIYEQFVALAGAAPEEQSRWISLCEAVAARLRAMLREGADESDPRLVMAAAGEVYLQHALIENGSDVQSVKVGDISVSEGKEGGGIKAAQALRDELMAGAASLLDCGFAGLWVMK